MPDTGSNIIVQTVGNTANLATDFGTSGVNLADAHIPLQKMAFGNSGAAIRVSASDPLPITVSSSDVAIVISGNVGNSGEFGVGNYNNQYLKVAGSTTGAGITVQGMVSVTAAAEGIRVTGGIVSGLNSTRDTVSVTGSVSLMDIDGSTGAAVKLYTGLTAIGSSGDALKVAVVNAGFTAVVSLSSIVGVTNGTGTSSIRVEGQTSGIEVGVTVDPLVIGTIIQPSGLTAGQHPVTGVGTVMPAAPLGSGVKLKAFSTNTATIYLGYLGISMGITTGYPLLAGESCFVEISNLNLVSVIGGATGQTISYLGS
jgi:hypothetical protein